MISVCPLDDLPPGAATVRVEADAPVRVAVLHVDGELLPSEVPAPAVG